MSILDLLGQRHNTDKASIWNGMLRDVRAYSHRYLPFYESFFSSMRDRPITFLEIGVEHGCSLKMWRDYFQFGKIVGMDFRALHDLSGDRVVIVQGDQRSVEDLARVAADHGPFDVVLDDAGHETSAQIMCYDYMTQHVRPGGFYVLEDIMDQAVVDHLCKTVSGLVLAQGPRVESVAFSYGTSVTKMRGP